jgi:hypothetical protein
MREHIRKQRRNEKETSDLSAGVVPAAASDSSAYSPTPPEFGHSFSELPVLLQQPNVGSPAPINGDLLRAHETASSEGVSVIPHEVQRTIDTERNGYPIDASLRTEMEAALGADFSEVRLHTGTQADGLARELGATAFTQGSDVFLNSDCELKTATGYETLAHELTHVAQHQTGRGSVQKQATAAAPGTASGTPAAASGEITQIHHAFISAKTDAITKFGLISQQQGATVQELKEAAKEKDPPPIALDVVAGIVGAAINAILPGVGSAMAG